MFEEPVFSSSIVNKHHNYKRDPKRKQNHKVSRVNEMQIYEHKVKDYYSH